MLKVGLTGGIGCGKSTAVDAFRVLGIPIVDADKISKDMVKQGSEALNEIAEVFGADLLLANGELNRALLKQKIFSDASSLAKLEAILHPRIKAEIKRQLSSIDDKNNNEHKYAIVDIPLLVEKNYQEMFDKVIVIDCLPAQQIERVMTRDGLTEPDVKRIMANQASREKRNSVATDVLGNSQDKETLNFQIKRLHKALLALS